MDDNHKMDVSETISLDSSVGLSLQGLIENSAVTSCLPSSPLRGTFNPSGSEFNFPYSQSIDNISLESQLLQRIQALNGYNSPSPFSYNYNQSLPLSSSTLYNQPLLNNNYTLQPAPQKKIPQSPLAKRHSYTASTDTEIRLSPTKNSESRSAPQYQTQSNPVQNQQAQQNLQYEQQPQSIQNQSIKSLKIQEIFRQQRGPNPNPQESSQNERRIKQFIKPLAQMGTLTTTDTKGRVRVIVPVPSSSNDDTGDLLLNLGLTDDLRPLNGPPITRSASEKVSNRSELMSQLQRGAWARHTTK